MRPLLFIPGFLVLSTICLSGCGGPSQPSVEVTGVVYYFDEPKVASTQNATLNVGKVGKPIAGAKVTFHGQGVPVGYGITDGLGRFRIRTYYQVAEPVDGLPLGLYAITITKLSLIEKTPPDLSQRETSQNEQVLPARYSDPVTTEWKSMEVKSAKGAKNHFHLTVSGQ